MLLGQKNKIQAISSEGAWEKLLYFPEHIIISLWLSFSVMSSNLKLKIAMLNKSERINKLVVLMYLVRCDYNTARQLKK